MLQSKILKKQNKCRNQSAAKKEKKNARKIVDHWKELIKAKKIWKEEGSSHYLPCSVSRGLCIAGQRFLADPKTHSWLYPFCLEASDLLEVVYPKVLALKPSKAILHIQKIKEAT